MSSFRTLANNPTWVRAYGRRVARAFDCCDDHRDVATVVADRAPCELPAEILGVPAIRGYPASEDRRVPVSQSLSKAALDYATAGVAVFPCHWPAVAGLPGGCSCGRGDCGSPAKHPITTCGYLDASSDPERVVRWWRRWPHANIGVPTGATFDVVDIDGPTGRAALRSLLGRDEFMPGPVVRTGRGSHYLVVATGHGCRVGLLPGVDYRGHGGYVIAPPSVHASGRCYRWHIPLLGDDAAPLPRLPEVLTERLQPAPRHDALTAPGRVNPDRYGQAALSGELGRLRAAQEGERNDTLNRAAFRCYQLAADGLLDCDKVTAAFTAAAQQAGLGQRETARTLASARAGGFDHPRRPTRHHLLGCETSAHAAQPQSHDYEVDIDGP